MNLIFPNKVITKVTLHIIINLILVLNLFNSVFV